MNLLKSLLSSKKFVALLIGLVISVAAAVGLNEELAKEISTVVVPLVAAYLVGQGVADHGKEKAKIEANGNDSVPKPEA